MSIVGVPVGGLKTVGQIVGTNSLMFRTSQNGLAIALELLSTHTPGAPVVDNKGKYVVFINEFDVLKAYEAGEGPEYPYCRVHHATWPHGGARFYYDWGRCSDDGGTACVESSRRN
jgi:hypothetical protein